MNILKSFKSLTKFETTLWLGSLVAITATFLLTKSTDYYTLIASLVGVTSLIFIAKGLVIGQMISVVFAVFYGIVSFGFRYYGEMITYLFLLTPLSILAVISWIKNPYKNTEQVTVSKLLNRQKLFITITPIVVAISFYFILKEFNTANLYVSVLSVATSFLASYLTFIRSPYYAVVYSINDIVLIVLWVLASFESIAYLTMVVCFVMFFLNDAYGFFNWKKMQKRQSIA